MLLGYCEDVDENYYSFKFIFTKWPHWSSKLKGMKPNAGPMLLTRGKGFMDIITNHSVLISPLVVEIHVEKKVFYFKIHFHYLAISVLPTSLKLCPL